MARYSFSRSIPPKFERKLRRHKQGFGKIDTTVVLDKDENLLIMPFVASVPFWFLAGKYALENSSIVCRVPF